MKKKKSFENSNNLIVDLMYAEYGFFTILKFCSMTLRLLPFLFKMKKILKKGKRTKIQILKTVKLIKI